MWELWKGVSVSGLRGLSQLAFPDMWGGRCGPSLGFGFKLRAGVWTWVVVC